MSRSGRVSVVGASGFIGSAVMAAVASRGFEAVAVQAPRVTAHGLDMHMLRCELDVGTDAVVAKLADALCASQACILAAGIADVTRPSSPAMLGANALLPSIVARAADLAGCRQFVHFSSAAVQGTCGTLDSSRRVNPQSHYAKTKAKGEQLLIESHGSSAKLQVVIFRPPGVHDASRAVTRQLAKFARSALSSVAGEGTHPTPQALVKNVADAAAFMLLMDSVPMIVHYPSEQLTTDLLLRALGARAPRHLRTPVAAAVLSIATLIGRCRPDLRANAVRLRILWFGEATAESWLSESGWRPPVGIAGWHQLGDAARRYRS